MGGEVISCFEPTCVHVISQSRTVRPCLAHRCSPAPCPIHSIPTDSQIPVSWTRMAKPRVMHVPQATQAAAVRGNGGWWGLREAGRTLWGYENASDNLFSTPVVPPDMRATPSSQAGSVSPPVSITAAIPWHLPGLPTRPQT